LLFEKNGALAGKVPIGTDISELNRLRYVIELIAGGKRPVEGYWPGRQAQLVPVDATSAEIR
jgi:hypothetical protein